MQRTTMARLRSIAAMELRTVGFTVVVVFMFSVFLATMGAGHSEVPFGEFAGDLKASFTGYMIAVAIMLLVVEPVRHLGPEDGPARAFALAGAIVAGCGLSTLVQVLWTIATDDTTFKQGAGLFWGGLSVSSFVLAAMLVAVAEFHRREVQSIEAMRAAEAQRAVLERESLEARLRTLEAQIEPHFLFNTLANVRRLYEVDATAGEAMMTRLIRYLEVALPSMRDEHSTLEREAHLVSAYLDLQQVRMGKRLAYGIDIAPALRSLTIPPMMLLTLVENAIKHGLTPKREGGRVDVSARLVAGELRVSVADTGRGFSSELSGGGTGLANIRARLAAMFGGAAGLTLAPGEKAGLAATIRLPVQG